MTYLCPPPAASPLRRPRSATRWSCWRCGSSPTTSPTASGTASSTTSTDAPPPPTQGNVRHANRPSGFRNPLPTYIHVHHIHPTSITNHPPHPPALSRRRPTKALYRDQGPSSLPTGEKGWGGGSPTIPQGPAFSFSHTWVGGGIPNGRGPLSPMCTSTTTGSTPPTAATRTPSTSTPSSSSSGSTSTSPSAGSCPSPTPHSPYCPPDYSNLGGGICHRWTSSPQQNQQCVLMCLFLQLDSALIIASYVASNGVFCLTGLSSFPKYSRHVLASYLHPTHRHIFVLYPIPK